MADSNILAFTELTALDQDEMLYIVDDPGGTPADRKITPATLASASEWVLIPLACTRTGNLTCTFASDVTSIFVRGTKFRYKEGANFEYGVVSTSVWSGAVTTITLMDNFNYAMGANPTGVWISRMDYPVGFPDWFDYAPTIGGFSSAPANGVYRWRTSGRQMTLNFRMPSDGTSNAPTFTITAPIFAATITNMLWQGNGTMWDNGAILANFGRLALDSASSTINVYSSAATGAWTASGGKRIVNGFISFEF